MTLKSLSSSSRGNIHILENGITTILLDCGVNYNRVNSQLNNLTLDGVLITHEHGDHINGCKSLSENKKTTFYGSKETLDHIKVPEFSKVPLVPFKSYKIGTFIVVAFKVSHDAINPVNYLIQDTLTNAKFLYITDTGSVDDLEFKDIDYIMIECNFDENWFLKDELTETEKIKSKRLMSEKGHLSLQKTIEFLKRTINVNTKKIILCHISHSYDDYIEFERKVKDSLNFEDVIALNPKLVGCVEIKLKIEKEVPLFE